MKRTIDVKDNRQTEELSAEIKELRTAVKLLEEKVAENRDMLENYLKERSGVADNNPEELKRPVENFREVGNAEEKDKSNDDNNAITSDI